MWGLEEASFFDEMTSNQAKLATVPLKQLIQTTSPKELKKTNGFNKQNGHSNKTNSNVINLEEQFKAACDTIQNLPKNGKILVKFE